MSANESATAGALERAWSRLRAAYRTSAVGSAASRLGDGLDRAVAGSRLRRGLTRSVRGSRLVRWLTAEPDTEVVVIDLRETWTVGPVLAVLDWLISAAARPWRDSGARSMARRTGDIVREAPVRVFGVVILAAVLASAVAGLVTGGLGRVGLALRLLALAAALAATRVDASWAELRDGRVGQVLEAVFVPPEPPEERESRNDDSPADRD